MKPTLCSRCKKNVAVVFITRLDNNGQGGQNEGLCLKCARELNIRPVTDMIEKMGLSDEDLEGLTSEMMSAFEGAESMEGLLGNLSGALGDAANSSDDDEEEDDEDNDTLYEVTCPNCGQVSTLDEETLMDPEGDLVCPHCGATFDVELEGTEDDTAEGTDKQDQ